MVQNANFMVREEHPAGAGLLYWLGFACEEARLSATPRKTRSQVAGLLGRGEQVVESFERGRHVPRDLDDLLAVYGYLTRRDPRDLVQAALKLWRKEGTAPAFTPPAESEPRRLPRTPRRPQLQQASDGHPKKRRKAG